MKIGIFDPYIDDLGGGEKYMATIAECLSKKHEVTIFWDNLQDIDNLLQRFSLDLSRVRISKNIFSKKVSLISRLVATRSYDVIILLSDGSIPVTLSKKLFIHLQAPMAHVKISNLKTKLKILRVDKFFCNAYFTKRYIDQQFGVDSAVIYPPVSIYKIPQRKKNLILHVGRFRALNVDLNRMVDYKKQSLMIDAFKMLVNEGLSEWRFALAVGLKEEDESNFKKLREDAAGYPIDFFMNKTNDELWNFYSKAKIYWHASGFGEDLKKYPERAEHFGISTVEAMGAGAVPVVINAGGQPEIVTEGVNGFLWNTIEELKEKTLLVIHDNKKREELVKNAQKRATMFSKERFCREIYELITK